MATKLTIYNGALLECGQRELASLSEEAAARRMLDRVWDTGGVDYCLGQGQWKFAKRTLQIASSSGMAQSFGYQYAFEKPTDHIRTTSLCSDEYGNAPLLRYTQEQSWWFADTDPIYVSYISNASVYGGDLAAWPEDFSRYVEAYFASRIVKRLTQDRDEWGRIHKLARVILSDARASDAMESPTEFPPPGSWPRARHRGLRSRADRGNRGSLLG